MKTKLPIVGEIRTGKDATKRVYTKRAVESVEKDIIPELGAAFLDLSDRRSDYRSVSDRLLRSYEGWVYANVSVLAEEISKLEFELYKITYVKGEPVWAEIDSHPLLDLLDKPNEFTTTSQLMYLTEAHIELAGDTFYLLDKPTNPTSMYVLAPDKVRVNPGGKESNYAIASYEFKDTIDGKFTDITYQAEEIIQIKTPNPSNPYRGKSVVEAAAVTIDSETLAQEFLKRFFLNNATPGMTLSSDQRISKDDIQRIESDLRARNRGVFNAFKTLILGGGLKPVSVQHSNKEMEYVALEEALRDKLMAMFKNTKTSLMITDDVNRANGENSMLAWKQNVIKPKMTRIVDTLNEFLVPRFGSNLVLTFCDPVPENAESEIDEIQKLVSDATTQIMTINEARAIRNLDPLVGEEYDTVNNVAATTNPTEQPIPKNLKNISLEKHMRRQGLHRDISIQRNIYQAARKVAQEIIKNKPKAKKGEPEKQKYRSVTNDQAVEYWTKQVEISRVVQTQYEEKISKFLSQIEEKAIQNLHQVVGKQYKVKTLIDEDQEIQAGIDLFTPLSIEIAALAGTEAYTLLNLNTLYNPSKDLRNGVKLAVERFTKSFVETDQEKLADILTNGLEQGRSIAQIEQDIRADFGDFRKMQSERISRTEILRASNAGQLDAFKESGVVQGKQWYNGSPCPECAPYDGQIEWDLNGKFYDDTTEFADGNPPLHPNCKCVLLPVLEQVNRATALKSKMDSMDIHIAELESQIDKRTKEYRDIKELRIDDQAYIKALEKYLGNDEPPREN